MYIYIYINKYIHIDMCIVYPLKKVMAKRLNPEKLSLAKRLNRERLS